MSNQYQIEYKLSWNDYGSLIEDLWKDLQTKLQQHNINIDALIIILREGGFTGLPLAYKLNTFKVLSIQFKYMLNDGGNELKYIASLPSINYELPGNPVFLLCDTFPAGGETKKLVIEKVKETYPTAEFVFASLIEDKTTATIPDILFSAFAIDADEDYVSKHPLLVREGVKNALNILLPWENEAEEVAAVSQTKWEYK